MQSRKRTDLQDARRLLWRALKEATADPGPRRGAARDQLDGGGGGGGGSRAPQQLQIRLLELLGHTESLLGQRATGSKYKAEAAALRRRSGLRHDQAVMTMAGTHKRRQQQPQLPAAALPSGAAAAETVRSPSPQRRRAQPQVQPPVQGRRPARVAPVHRGTAAPGRNSALRGPVRGAVDKYHGVYLL
eukprot:SAG22_NODE_1768_length_3615_cov_6.235495_2_plen_188_part_00